MTGINRLQVSLSRQDLAARWQCRVSSPALTAPLVADLQVDVHGKECSAINLDLGRSVPFLALFLFII